MKMKLLDMQLIEGFYLDRSKNLKRDKYIITRESGDRIVFSRNLGG